MTVHDVEEALKKIEAVAHDGERAHEREIALREAVLQSIADGDCEDPRALARAALKSSSFDFARWCS